MKASLSMYGRNLGSRTFYLQSKHGNVEPTFAPGYGSFPSSTTRTLMQKLAPILIHKLRVRQPPVDWPLLPLESVVLEKSGNQPNFAGAEQRLADARAVRRKKQRRQASASLLRSGVNGFLDGVFGQGLDENIRLAYEWLIETTTKALKSSFSVSAVVRLAITLLP